MRAKIITQALWICAALGLLIFMLCDAQAAGPVRIGGDPTIYWSDSARNVRIFPIPDSLRLRIEAGSDSLRIEYLMNSGWRFIPGDTGIYVPVERHPTNPLLHRSPDGWVEHWVIRADTSLYWIAVRILAEEPCTTVVKVWRPSPSPSY